MNAICARKWAYRGGGLYSVDVYDAQGQYQDGAWGTLGEVLAWLAARGEG